jgi:acyl CoA:acetate/3-ketoacid CoA transferase beta subunit
MKQRVRPRYVARELMIVAAAREIADSEVVFVGIGMGVAAASLAKLTHAPNTKVVFESGIVDTNPINPSIGIADPRLAQRCSKTCGTSYILGIVQAGRVDVSLLGAAEVDKYGNLNSTAIGDYQKPDIRFPGSGGANDAASHSKRTLVMIPHQRRRLPETVSYVTSPGFFHGASRAGSGLKGGGPSRVITNLAVLGFHPRSRIMRVVSIHPGVPADEVRKNTGFDITIPTNVPRTEPPTPKELSILRTKIDPNRFFTDRRL